MEQMMAELIRIVGNTNSAVEELRSEVAELRSEIAELRSRVDDLALGQASIVSRLGRIEADVHEIKESHKSLIEIVGEHDVAIRTLRRRPV
jgi:chromosome segregation ATPase